jgi:hypothetical protein
MEMPTYGTGRDLEDLGDLGTGKAFQLEQLRRDALLLRELAECISQPDAQLGLLCGAVRERLVLLLRGCASCPRRRIFYSLITTFTQCCSRKPRGGDRCRQGQT